MPSARLPASASPVARLVTERFWPGVTEEAAQAAMEGVRSACEELASSGTRIRWLGGTLVAVDEVLTLRFEGTQAAVESAYQLAGQPFDRLLVSMELEGTD